MCVCCVGLTHAHELASKHAKARAPSTTHDSSAEWQKQEHGEKGDVDQWEGELLVLAVGNAQQAGKQHLIIAKGSQHSTSCLRVGTAYQMAVMASHCVIYDFGSIMCCS